MLFHTTFGCAEKVENFPSVNSFPGPSSPAERGFRGLRRWVSVLLGRELRFESFVSLWPTTGLA